jgi:uncharacterized membrane protein YhaH (DUF805 family)
MSERRTIVALVVFVLDVLVCGTWAFREASSMLEVLSGSGSGGIAGVSAGVVEGLFTVVPPILTIWLARVSGSALLARRWRNAHLAVILALVIAPVVGSLQVMMVSIVVFLPVQVFFVVGALAIWFARPRKRPDAPSEAAS